MLIRPLGESGIEASAVALGTWVSGGWMWGGSEEQESIDAIRAAIDAGITLIDTAPVYGFGRSEELVGRAIEGRRESVIVATKCGLVWDDAKGTQGIVGGERFFETDEDSAGEGKDRAVHRHLSPESIRREVEASLRRLKTDYIDLYQTHWQDSTVPIEETMGCLLALKGEGKIRAIGVSNASDEELARYRAVGPVDSDQEKYSMLDRELERTRLPLCLAGNIAVLAYSPLALGLLTGKVGPERTFPTGDLRNSRERFSPEHRASVLAMLDEIREVTEAHGLTFAQLVIAWTIRQPGLTHALVGARTPKQAEENAAAGRVELEPDELAIIDAAIAEHVSDVP